MNKGRVGSGHHVPLRKVCIIISIIMPYSHSETAFILSVALLSEDPPRKYKSSHHFLPKHCSLTIFLRVLSGSLNWPTFAMKIIIKWNIFWEYLAKITNLVKVHQTLTTVHNVHNSPNFWCFLTAATWKYILSKWPNSFCLFHVF